MNDKVIDETHLMICCTYETHTAWKVDNFLWKHLRQILTTYEYRMQTQFLYWFGKVRAYVQYSSNLLEIFHSLCENPFTKSEPHRDNPSIVFRNSYNLRDPRSLNQSLCIRKKKTNSLLKRRILQLKSMEKLLMNL